MTKEQLEQLKKWDGALRNAVNLDYLRLTAAEFKEVYEIYKEVFNETLKKSQLNCNTCRLNALKKLGKAYLEELNKPKRGRPKKINLDGDVNQL